MDRAREVVKKVLENGRSVSDPRVAVAMRSHRSWVRGEIDNGIWSHR
jgi:hypothetical protein